MNRPPKKLRRRPARAAALLVTALAVLAGGCGKKGAAPEEAPPVPSARTPWVKARSSDGVPFLEAPAQVLPSPEGQAAVVPPYRARIVKVLVRPGTKVTRGQPLVEVVMPEVSTAAGAYYAASTRVAAYEKRKAQLEGLKKDGLVRLADVLEADTKLAEARADQQAAAAALRTAQIEPAEAEGIVSGKRPVVLRSPIAGVVVAVGAAVGDSREPSGEPVVRVAGEGDSRVEARFSRPVDPRNAAYELVVTGGTRYPLQLVARAPVVDPRDGTISVWLVPEKGVRLQPGLTGRVSVALPGTSGAAVVPGRAVALAEGKPYVVVRRDGKPERVEVDVFASTGAETLVTGVSAGEEVAADAALAEVPPEGAAPAAGEGKP
ncbi:MAG TPA: efflux RND transporter periplasmic adaptor subunit [Anaeromyxobacteraceae bacterium]|nr:efflux RND transporter periplasmic adaptor subunit [Anaeromyxobacteraceae bacterium]